MKFKIELSGNPTEEIKTLRIEQWEGEISGISLFIDEVEAFKINGRDGSIWVRNMYLYNLYAGSQSDFSRIGTVY